MISGPEVRARRVERGLTQQQLADLAGVSQRAVSNIECERYFGNTEVRLALAPHLGFDPEAMREGAFERDLAPASFAGEMYKRRKELGLSQKVLAHLAGVGESTVGEMESRGRRVSRQIQKLLEDALDRAAEDLPQAQLRAPVREIARRPGPITPQNVYKGEVREMSFVEGRTYLFAQITREGMGKGITPSFHITPRRRFVFLRDEPGQGCVLHVFRNVDGGYMETFTDAQCSEYKISEV